MLLQPKNGASEIQILALDHLQWVVRQDSSSDESSESIPSTQGQIDLSEKLSAFFSDLGYSVELDPYANLIAHIPGRGAGVDKAPLALLIHLDTARGTHPVEELCLENDWNGEALHYPLNPSLCVDVETYPSLRAFLGHDVLHGPGDAPFGLDDKLGLTHLMTLACLLRDNPEASHPPLMLIGRPDEEIGRMAAVEGLAELLAARGVLRGFTVDGIDPFEVNVENFNASQGLVRIPEASIPSLEGTTYAFSLLGVNTHGATAKAESHRGAPRLAAEILAEAQKLGLDPHKNALIHFESDAERDCDAVTHFLLQDEACLAILEEAFESVIGPHRARGANWERVTPQSDLRPSLSFSQAVSFVGEFLQSNPGFCLAAEDSDGRLGYTQPYRIKEQDGGTVIFFRIRDFDTQGLERRENHLREMAAEHSVEIHHQYVNMGPSLRKHDELVRWPAEAADELDVRCPVQPIRGGTGVDPFIAKGVPIGNLGTGYFAPESEKELTSLQLMEQHAKWLFALVQVAAK